MRVKAFWYDDVLAESTLSFANTRNQPFSH
jgi:hypothetical protein